MLNVNFVVASNRRPLIGTLSSLRTSITNSIELRPATKGVLGVISKLYHKSDRGTLRIAKAFLRSARSLRGNFISDFFAALYTSRVKISNANCCCDFRLSASYTRLVNELSVLNWKSLHVRCFIFASRDCYCC